jgi:glycosyltransferase involved in cell wall biosynthesis
VKEADALAAAGFRVRLVSCERQAWTADWDRDLVRGRPWSFAAVPLYRSGASPGYFRVRAALRQQAFRALATTATFGAGIAERAFSRPYAELVELAARESADIYIAHNAEALPPAFAAARMRGAALAFDSEDLHTGELPNHTAPTLFLRLLEHSERRYLPECCYVSAPSQPVADALCARYGIPRPLTIHNVFPWADRRSLDGACRDRRGPRLSLYWYSQIIGLDRGLQDCIRAAGLLTQPVQIHLRGALTRQVEHELRSLAAANGVADALFMHEPVPPNELLSRANEHDLGLALEQPVSENRLLTVTNKIFQYLLAGISVAATDTIGQRSVMEANPGVGFMYQPGDYRSMARELQNVLDNPRLLEERKRAALCAAEQRWNWETESQSLVAVIERELRSRTGFTAVGA